MLKRYLLTLCSALPFFSFAQGNMSILFVDDSDDTFDNAETFANAIASLGYAYEFHDAVAMGSPVVQDMELFDLVVWYTGSDGTDLQLWSGNETDNEDIVGYLEGGGALWLVGLDFLFDRYGTPPAQFDEDDFVSDFLGISSYEVQSYGNDGELGVSFLNPSLQSPIVGNTTIDFIFETLWWVDGVTLLDNAEPVYEMGGNDYPLEGQVCGLYYQHTSTSALTYLFDISLVDPALLASAIQPALTFFESQVLWVFGSLFDEKLEIFPNPNTGSFRIVFNNSLSPAAIIRLYDSSGRLVYDTSIPFQQSIQIGLPANFPSGLYNLEVQNGEVFYREKIVVIKN